MKNAFITGASRGLGLEMVRQLLDCGHRVWATYREEKTAKELFRHQKEHDRLETLHMDVSDESSILEASRKLSGSSIKFDLLFNNAGIMDWNDFDKVDPVSFARVYEVNVIGAFLVTRHFLEHLHQKGGKRSRVVNLSSRLGSISLRGDTQLGGALAYQCSKAALNMLTKQISLELEPFGISVISISPGWVKTDMGGMNAKYEIEDSVRMTLSSLASLPLEKTGVFIGEDGREIPW